MKHLNKIYLLLAIVILSFIFSSCKREVKKDEYLAKVNETHLLRNEFVNLTDSTNSNKLTDNEIIRNWVNDELLYQEAVKNGIVESKDYKKLIKDSKRKIAGALLLNKIAEKNKIPINEQLLQAYYHKQKNNFKLFDNAILLNKITFKNEESAILYRNFVIKNNWEKAYLNFKNDSSIISVNNNILLYNYQINPKKIFRIIRGLNKNEISLVIKIDNNNFAVIQLLKKIKKGIIPSFSLIKNKVKDRYKEELKTKYINKFINKLYKKNKIVINKIR